MLSFQFYQKTKILCGKGAINQLGELADHMGGKKALIVADPGMMATGVVDKIAEALKAGGKEYVIFDENEPNPPIAACEKGYEICMAENCDFIIGIGGGPTWTAPRASTSCASTPVP